MNAYIRFKLALTEDLPLIKPYNEAKCAELGDVKGAPIEPSLALLENLHKRWVLLLRTLGPAEWSRQFRHPEWDKPMSLDDTLALYAWHGKHHVAHITSCANAKAGGKAPENGKTKLENGKAGFDVRRVLEREVKD